MYLKTKEGYIYIVIGRKNLKWVCITPFVENPNDLLEDSRTTVLIDKKDIGIMSKDYNKVKKFLYIRKVLSYKWFTCINNKHEFYGISYHWTKNEALLFKTRQKRSNNSFYTETKLPCNKTVSEETLKEIEEKKSIMIRNKRTSTLFF